MYTSSNPRLLSFGSAAIHIRSSPATCCEYGFGGPKVVPPSSDLPVVMLASVRLEYASKLSVEGGVIVGDVSCGPMAQSQSPPPTVLSGKPRKVDADPSWRTRNALQPAGTPVGPMTNDWPNWSVRMLGSAALALPLSRRFGLKVAVGGSEVETCAVPPVVVAASIGLPLVDGISETTSTNAVPSARMRPMRPPSAQKNFGDAGFDYSRDALATRCMTGARTRARSLGRSTFRRRSREGQRQGNSSALVPEQDRTFIWFDRDRPSGAGSQDDRARDQHDEQHKHDAPRPVGIDALCREHPLRARRQI